MHLIKLINLWKKLPSNEILNIYGINRCSDEVLVHITGCDNIHYYSYATYTECYGLLKESCGLFICEQCTYMHNIMLDSFSVGCPVIVTDDIYLEKFHSNLKGVLSIKLSFDTELKKFLNNFVSNLHKYSNNAYMSYQNILIDYYNFEALKTLESQLSNQVTFKQDKIFIYSGRLEENKGILHLLKYWKEFPDEYILHIYGEGTCRKVVEEVANKSHNIKYFGFQDRKLIFNDIMKSTAVIVCSELVESFGMSIPESYAFSTPVIVTNLGNQSSIVEESKGGVVYDYNDSDSLLKALKTIVNAIGFYSLNAFLYYKGELSESMNYNKLIEIYNTLIVN